jgi:hypothetical protein
LLLISRSTIENSQRFCDSLELIHVGGVLDSEWFSGITNLDLSELSDSLSRTNSLNERVTRHKLSFGVGLIVNIGKVGQDTGVLGTGNSSLFHIVGDHSN